MTVVWSIIGFVVVMGIIVAIHEWGHFQVARWFNVKINVFSIGFGPSIYEKQGAEITFRIGAIPLGGYVRFADEREGPVEEVDLPRAFNRQPVYKRFAIVAAGPIVNLVLAWFAFSLMYMLGINGFKPLLAPAQQNQPIASAFSSISYTESSDDVWRIAAANGTDVSTWQGVQQQIMQALVADKSTVLLTFASEYSDEKVLYSLPLAALDIDDVKQSWLSTLGFVPFKPPLPPVLGEVLEGEPAWRAGLQENDEIHSLNGEEIKDWQAFVSFVQAHPDQQVKVTFYRNQVLYDATVTLAGRDDKQGSRIGVMGVALSQSQEAMEPYVSVMRYNLMDASVMAYQRSVDLVVMSLQMLQRMLFGDIGLQHLSGPISIAQFSGQAVQSGLIAFLSLLGLISLSVGVLNLLPIPVLDGGHLVYYLIEMLKGSPVKEVYVEIGQRIGIALILSLTFIALFNDVLRISHG